MAATQGRTRSFLEMVPPVLLRVNAAPPPPWRPRYRSEFDESVDGVALTDGDPVALRFPQQQHVGHTPHNALGAESAFTYLPPQNRRGRGGGTLQEPMLRPAVVPGGALNPPGAWVVSHPEFETSLTGCLGAKGASTCLNASLLPYCTATRQSNYVGSDGRNSSMFHWTCFAALLTDGAMWFLMAVVPTPHLPWVLLRWVLGPPMLTFLIFYSRCQVRQKFGIQPNWLQDLCVSWWCPFCAIGQQQSELDLRGWFPGAFCEAPASRAPIAVTEMI